MEAAVAALESAQPIVIDPEMIEHTVDDDDLPTDAVHADRSEDGHDAWPTLPVWLWTEENDDGLAAGLLLERVDGIKAKLLDIPHDERSLTVLREGLGAAMIWLTGCESPDAAARELMKQPLTTLTPYGEPRSRERNPKSPTKKRATRPSSEPNGHSTASNCHRRGTRPGQTTLVRRPIAQTSRCRFRY